MKNKKIDQYRRKFLKNTSYLSLATLASTKGVNALPALKTKPMFTMFPGEVAKWHNCWAHCTSSCLLKVIVKDGEIKRIETDDRGDDQFGRHQVRACLRGRSLHKRTYAPDRLKYPMKRVGERGEGKFVKISWDEALEEVHKRLSTIIEKYGNQSIFYRIGYGLPQGPYHYVERFLNSIGGFLGAYGSYSYQQIAEAAKYTYGSPRYMLGGSPTEIANSDLVVYFGNNPANTRMSGGGDTYTLQYGLRQSKAKVIIIDPRYTDTACGKEDQWVPIRPGTDAALVEGLAWVLIKENLVNEDFLKKYCYGYDEEAGDAEKGIPSLDKSKSYKAYILGGGEDKIEKTPEYASAICGVPVDNIYKLARELAAAKAPYISQGWGPQRQAAGEQNARSIFMLPILLGQLGLPGTNIGANDPQYITTNIMQMPTLENKVKKKISTFKWVDAITKGKDMDAKGDGVKGGDTLGSDVKCVIQYQGNWMINQHSDCNKTDKVLRDESLVDFIFVMDNHMTPSAKYADILLPDITWLENSRIVQFSTHLTMTEKVIDPMYECRHPYDVFADLAERFGVRDKFSEGRNWDQWMEHLYRETAKKRKDYPTFEELKEKRTIRTPFDPKRDGYVLKDFRKDPETNPLRTKTGKIEIFSIPLAEYADDSKMNQSKEITPLPNYIKTWEGYEDHSLKDKYPLQLIGFKTKGRVHSTYQNIPWLKEAVKDALSMNPVDAKERGIKSGQLVHVFNGRGTIEVSVNITPRIMPGVVALAQGSWYSPNEKGIDVGGCVNTLTKQHATDLAKGNPQSTNLVEVKAI